MEITVPAAGFYGAQRAWHVHLRYMTELRMQQHGIGHPENVAYPISGDKTARYNTGEAMNDTHATS